MPDNPFRKREFIIMCSRSPGTRISAGDKPGSEEDPADYRRVIKVEFLFEPVETKSGQEIILTALFFILSSRIKLGQVAIREVKGVHDAFQGFIIKFCC